MGSVFPLPGGEAAQSSRAERCWPELKGKQWNQLKTELTQTRSSDILIDNTHHNTIHQKCRTNGVVWNCYKLGPRKAHYLVNKLWERCRISCGPYSGPGRSARIANSVIAQKLSMRIRERTANHSAPTVLYVFLKGFKALIIFRLRDYRFKPV